MKWALLLLFAALPLQWFLLPLPTPAHQRAHLVALVLFAVLALARYRASRFVPVMSMAWAFVLANLALSTIWAATAVYHGGSLRDPFYEVVLLFIFLAVATVIHHGCTHPGSGVIQTARWAALVTTLSLSVALSASLAFNGVNPVSVFQHVMLTGDTRILGRELFRSAFAGFGYEAQQARANMRHEVFGAVLVSIYLSMIAARMHPFASTWARNVYRASVVVGLGLIVLSLSRSVMIAALAIPLLSLVRTLRSGRLSPRQIGAVAATGLGLIVLATTGLLGVLHDRFAHDTSSYQARDQLLHQAVTNIGEHTLTGGVSTVGASSHDLILDSWLRSGIFGGAFAVFIVALVIGVWFVLVVGLPRAPDWMLPVTAAIALPVVRMLTAGGGLIPPVEWVCLGVVAGFLRYRLDLARSPAVPTPAAAPGLATEVR